MARTGRPRTTPDANNPVASLRRSRGWSQAETASMLGISRQSVSDYETGTRQAPGPVRLLCQMLMQDECTPPTRG